ncbi:MAG: hypothetical protein ACJA1A_001235 [Saprospiraceae bacterium]
MIRNKWIQIGVCYLNTSIKEKVKRYLLVLVIGLGITFQSEGQVDVMKKDEGSWNMLAMVTFQRTFDEEFGIDVQKPIISPIILAMDGKEIVLEGYIIPLTGKIKQSHFMLSKFTQNMCFFCGKAGPETAAQVFTKGGKKIAFTDEKVKVRGILRVNVTDVTSLLYTIEDGVMID